MKYLILSSIILFSIHSAACDESKQFAYCVGDQVLDQSGTGAKIVAKFPNGEIIVRWRLSPPSKALPTEMFAVKRGCTQGQFFCVGDMTYTVNGSRVKVTGIYQDGSVAVRFPPFSTSTPISTSELAIP